MAEIAVSLVVDKLIPLLAEEENLLRGVHQEVDDIKRELQSILAFLKDADRRAEAEGDDTISSSNVVKLWVEELREAALQIENVIDEYTRLTTLQRRRGRSRFVGFLCRVACLIVQLKPRHDIASKVKQLKRTVQDIHRRSAEYGFNPANQASSSNAAQHKTWWDPRKDCRFMEDSEVVGFDSARDELVGVLEGESPVRAVISVVGMGGLGKTTLARQVYNRVKAHFECHAWIEVSQSYDQVEILRNLIKELCESRKEPFPFPQEIDAMGENTVVDFLRDYLRGKRYLISFDDVWDTIFWAAVQRALPYDNEKKGRIMITTRISEVAKSCKTSSCDHIHHLQALNRDKAWELFCKKAFQFDFDGNCPSHLKKLSSEIVERCGGLPLAIVVIAGLLSFKDKVVDEWRTLLTNLSSELERNKHLESISKILSLSYYDLPYYLKSCFLYFGIFPEDYSVRCRRLFRLWIAEGFVKQEKNETLEVTAEKHLIELINRNVVQVSKIDRAGKPKTCRIHDLLREVILKKMEDLKFCHVLSRDHLNFKCQTRRVSTVQNSEEAFAKCNEIFDVRSVFVFDTKTISSSARSKIVRNFKLLKVLDFEDAPNVDQLPKDIGNLFHLQYLSVRGTRVKLLPKSIRKLENLETLDLKESLVHELPVEIHKLYKLRHLLAYRTDAKSDSVFGSRRGVRIQKGFGCLKALHKLYLIEANVEGVEVFEEVSKLTELRKLVVSKVRSEDGRALCGCVEKMKHLETLEVFSASEDDVIDLESISSPPQSLRGLYLHGRLRSFPEWITKLDYVVRITLTASKLEDDPLKALRDLPNLLTLGIVDDAYCGETLQFEKGGFLNLKILRLILLSRLNSLVIEEGAFPNLEELWILGCSQLKEDVPSGFQNHPKPVLVSKDGNKFFIIPEIPMTSIRTRLYSVSVGRDIHGPVVSTSLRMNEYVDWDGLITLLKKPSRKCSRGESGAVYSFCAPAGQFLCAQPCQVGNPEWNSWSCESFTDPKRRA